MSKTLYRTFVLFIVFSFVFAVPVYAQGLEPEISLGLARTMGYGGFGGEIQGTFTISATSDGDLESVVFYFNDILLGEDNEAPFKLQFNTNIIEPGPVDFSAIGVFVDGSSAKSDVIQRIVLSEDSVTSAMTGMIVPLLLVFAVIIGVTLLLQLTRKKKGVEFIPGKYGAAGGTICPKCTLPFSRSVLSPNLLVGKLERCPHCGKFSIRPRASSQALLGAEARYLESDQPTSEHLHESDEDKLRKMIDDSRFDQN